MIRCYKLNPHDVFTIWWTDEKYLIGLPIIIHKAFYKKIWYKPRTWFQKCYKVEYIGENKIQCN